MQYSIHIPLLFGLLKIKSAGRLRRDEARGDVPVWRIGDMCFVWRPRRKRPARPRQPPLAGGNVDDDERDADDSDGE